MLCVHQSNTLRTDLCLGKWHSTLPAWWWWQCNNMIFNFTENHLYWNSTDYRTEITYFKVYGLDPKRQCPVDMVTMVPGLLTVRKCPTNQCLPKIPNKGGHSCRMKDQTRKKHWSHTACYYSNRWVTQRWLGRGCSGGARSGGQQTGGTNWSQWQ